MTGELPTPHEVRAFLADTGADKRATKIDELLDRPGHAALWTLKFCDLLKASDFGVYADGIRQEVDAPRFQAWVRAGLEENTPYDQFVERILTATSRDGPGRGGVGRRGAGRWRRATAPAARTWPLYRQRKTLDLYWQRRGSSGVPAALQVAHAFLGLRLECAQCHRHPHDVWQQDDLLSFANFFMRVRKIGFQGDNEKKYPEVGRHLQASCNDEAKKLEAEAKKLRRRRVQEARRRGEDGQGRGRRADQASSPPRSRRSAAAEGRRIAERLGEARGERRPRWRRSREQVADAGPPRQAAARGRPAG